MKKALFILDHWYSDLGGRKKAFILSLSELSKIYDSLNIVNLEIHKKSSEISADIVNENLPLGSVINNFFLNKKNPFRLIYSLIKVIIKVRSLHPSAIILGGAGPHTNVLFWIISKITGFKGKTIAIEQGNSSQIMKDIGFISRAVTKYLFKKIDIIVVVSQEMAEETASFFSIPRNKIEWIYNFADIHSIRELAVGEIEEKNIFNTENKVIISGCRLDLRQKDIITLLNVMEIIKKEYNAPLVIIGDGPDRKIIEKEIKKRNLEEKVFLLGYKKNPYKYLSKSSIFILSSFHEGLPLIITEAMSCGLPVVASNCKFGPREILEDGKYGFLFDVGDSHTAADCISKLLADDNLRETYHNKSLLRAKDFDISIASLKYHKLFLKHYN